MYWQAITVIEAQEMLKQIKVSSFPNMKLADQRRVHKELTKQAFPSVWDKEKNRMTPEEFAKLVHG